MQCQGCDLKLCLNVYWPILKWAVPVNLQFDCELLLFGCLLHSTKNINIKKKYLWLFCISFNFVEGIQVWGTNGTGAWFITNKWSNKFPGRLKFVLLILLPNTTIQALKKSRVYLNAKYLKLYIHHLLAEESTVNFWSMWKHFSLYLWS